MANRMKTVRYSLGNSKHLSFDVGKGWNVTGGGVTFTNVTAALNNATTGDVAMGVAVSDALYIGSATIFDAFAMVMTVTAAGGTRVAEYWNGSTWATLSTSGTALNALATNGMVYWTAPTDWATTQVGSEVDGPWYYIRIRVSALATTGGTFTGVNLAQLLAHQGTVNLPETSSRTIRKAWVRVTFGGSLLAILEQFHVQSRWASTAYADPITRWVTQNNFTAVAESWSYDVNIDVTSQTVTQWASGTDATFDFRLSYCMRGVVANGTRMWSSCELFITYEHDETAATQLNTLVLPIDSLTGTVAATATTIQASGIPILTGGSGLIKEATPVIKDLYIAFESNVDESGTTDYTFYGQLAAEAEVALVTFDAANQSDFYTRMIWRRTDITTTSAYDVKCRTSSVTGATFPHMGAFLVVTYSYDDTTTATVTHTDVIPVDVSPVVLGGTAAADKTYAKAEFWIEGASPALLQSGVQLFSYQSADPGDVLLSLSSQTARTYTVPPTVVDGPVSIIQRMDSGGAAGLGLAFARGKCELQISIRRNGGNTSSWGCYGVAYITYSHTREATRRHSTIGYPAVLPANAAATGRATGALQLQIPDSNWFIHAIGVLTNEVLLSGIYAGAKFTIKRTDNDGYSYLGGGQRAPSAYITPLLASYSMLDIVLRYTLQPASFNRLDIVAASRVVYLDNAMSNRLGSAIVWANYHNFAFTVGGDISGSGGGTSVLELLDFGTKERYQIGSKVGDGAYSFTHFDSARPVFVTAYINTLLLGMSADGQAT